MTRFPASALRQCVALATLVTLLGCAGDPPRPDDRLPLEGQSVRVLVVDDPGLAAAVGGLAAAWKERSGAELAVEEVTSAAMAERMTDGAERPMATSSSIPHS